MGRCRPEVAREKEGGALHGEGGPGAGAGRGGLTAAHSHGGEKGSLRVGSFLGTHPGSLSVRGGVATTSRDGWQWWVAM
jgi:hypothetical protein